jgi:hypothetical protein
MDPSQKSQTYEEFMNGTFKTTLNEIERLIETTEDPPTEPFKSKYRANALIVVQKHMQYFCFKLPHVLSFFLFANFRKK